MSNKAEAEITSDEWGLKYYKFSKIYKVILFISQMP